MGCPGISGNSQGRPGCPESQQNRSQKTRPWDTGFLCVCRVTAACSHDSQSWCSLFWSWPQPKNSGSGSFTQDAELDRIGVLPLELQTAFKSTLPWTEVSFTSTIQITSYPLAMHLPGIEKRWEHRKETVKKFWAMGQTRY